MTRRHIFTAIAAVALLVVGSIGFGVWRAYSAPADLMQPGPLGDESLGDANAPNVIIEYASMTCPHCARFTNEVFPLLKQRHIDTGRVRYIFREFPLDPLAGGAAALARCAGKDKFFPTIELLFRTQQTWAVEHPEGPLLATVKQVGFTEESFKACLADQKILDGIIAVRDRAANDFKVEATPTFFINGEMKVGALSIDEIEALLKPAAPAAPSK
jgi:protein-disulfide isomerase